MNTKPAEGLSLSCLSRWMVRSDWGENWGGGGGLDGTLRRNGVCSDGALVRGKGAVFRWHIEGRVPGI